MKLRSTPTMTVDIFRQMVLAIFAEQSTVPASYIIGSVASFWMIERVVGFWA